MDTRRGGFLEKVWWGGKPIPHREVQGLEPGNGGIRGRLDYTGLEEATGPAVPRNSGQPHQGSFPEPAIKGPDVGVLEQAQMPV